MEAAVTTFGIWQIFILITFVLAVLMPFFVLRIRNESIKTNKKLDEIISLMSKGEKAKRPADKYICPVCKAENLLTAKKCCRCGEEII